MEKFAEWITSWWAWLWKTISTYFVTLFSHVLHQVAIESDKSSLQKSIRYYTVKNIYLLQITYSKNLPVKSILMWKKVTVNNQFRYYLFWLFFNFVNDSQNRVEAINIIDKKTLLYFYETEPLNRVYFDRNNRTKTEPFFFLRTQTRTRTVFYFSEQTDSRTEPFFERFGSPLQKVKILTLR